MKLIKCFSVSAVACACVVAAPSKAATIPAGTTIAVSTVSQVTSKTVPGRTFEAKLAKDVSINGKVMLKAGSKAFGKVTTSRHNPRKNEPLTVELTSVSVNGRNVTLKTDTFQPGTPTVTARQAQYGHTAGTLVVNPGTLMQFRLLQPVTL